MEKICCVTGHRDIPEEKIEYVNSELRYQVLQAVEDGYTHFISGFAYGADLLFAAIVAELRINNPALTLEAALPYRNRVNATDKLFRQLLSECNAVGIISEVYSRDCFMIRNRFMVSRSGRVIAVYDGREKGGTCFTMRYAHSQQKELKIINI